MAGRRLARWRRCIGLAVPMVVLAACGGTGATRAPGGDGDGAGLRVVVTTTVLGDIATKVVGDAGEVAVVLPRGADPHGYQPSAREVERMTDADLLVVNGGGLEQSLVDAVAEAEDAGVPVFTAMDHVEPLVGTHHGDVHGHAEDEHEDERSGGEAGHAHGEGAVDPHFWFDPRRTVAVVGALGAELAGLAPGGGFTRRVDAYARRLETLDEEVADLLAAVPEERRTLVTNHDALGYLAERYDFRVVGSVVPGTSTGAEPSAADLAALAERVREADVGAVFTDVTASGRLAETLAAEVGGDLRVVPLYTGSLGEEGSPAGTYTGMLRVDAERIADALTG